MSARVFQLQKQPQGVGDVFLSHYGKTDAIRLISFDIVSGCADPSVEHPAIIAVFGKEPANRLSAAGLLEFKFCLIV